MEAREAGKSGFFRFLGWERPQYLSKGRGEETRIDEKLKIQRTEVEISERVTRNRSQGIAEEKRREEKGQKRRGYEEE